MRILSERPNHDGEGAAGQKSASDGCTDSRVHEHNVVPLHDLLPRSSRDQTRRQSHRGCPAGSQAGFGQGGCGMTTSSRIPQQVEEILTTHRRGFLKSAGLLVVSFAAGAGAVITDADAQNGAAAQPPVLIPIPISGNSIRGSSFMRTTQPRFTSAKRTAARAPEP